MSTVSSKFLATWQINFSIAPLGKVTTPPSLNSSLLASTIYDKFSLQPTPSYPTAFQEARTSFFNRIDNIQSAGGAFGHGGFTMLLPKGGVNWKGASSRLPPSRAIWVFLTRTRFLLCLAVAGVVLLFWRGVSTSAGEMQR